MQPAYRLAPALRFAALGLTLSITAVCGEPHEGLPNSVSLIQVDPHHPNTLLAATATARLFRSRDAGDTWTPLPFPAESRSTLHAMLIDPVKENVYWLALSSEAPRFAGVFRSMDEGATWQAVPGLEGKQVWSLVFWTSDTQVMAAGTEKGVYFTHDGGENWTLPSAPGGGSPHPVMSLAFDPTDADTLYAGTPHLAWKTEDGGKTWRAIHKGMEEDSDIFSLDVDAKLRTRLFAAACSGIYRSLDGGRTWFSLEHALGGQVRTYKIISSPRRPDAVYAATSAGVVVSWNGGSNWHRRTGKAARSVALDPANSRRIFVATDAGILRSEDGGIHFERTGTPESASSGRAQALPAASLGVLVNKQR